MQPAHALTQTRKQSSTRQPKLEHLEDRVVPGEMLTGLLLLPMGPFTIQEFLGESVAVREDSSASAATQSWSATGYRDGLLADASIADLPGAAGRFWLFDRLGTDGQAPAARTINERSADSAHDLLLPELGPAGDLAGGGWGFPAAFGSAPAPMHLLGGTIEIGRAGAGANLPAPVPIHAAGGANLPASVPIHAAGPTTPAGAAGAVPGEGRPATEAHSGPPTAFPLHEGKSTRHRGGGGGGTPSGYSPAQIRHAYGFDQLTKDGTGVKIAIVDAYDDPNIPSDLNTFSLQFGLPTTSSFTFTQAYAQGSRPVTNAGWAQEISLDVEWAHAIAPKASILLVETASNSFDDLFGGVDYAVAHGASVVSMSWGGSEFSGESSYDTHFTASGVSFFAAAGDSGGQQIYPAVSPYVVAVGGTTLSLDGSGNVISETAWSGGGGGPSNFEPKPGYQVAYGTPGSTRDTPDVSYDANPSTGVAVYDSVPYQFQSGWLVFGGTSVGAPNWAAAIALADQGRATPVSSNNLASSALYNAATTNGSPGGANYAANYRDITSGSNGYPATPGYDLATGLGSPLANNLAPYLNTHLV
jgi:hypothetical protein